jgi:hypothetical protein
MDFHQIKPENISKRPPNIIRRLPRDASALLQNSVDALFLEDEW